MREAPDSGHQLVPLVVALVAIAAIGSAALVGLAVTHNLTSETTPLVTTILGLAGALVPIILLTIQATRNAQGIQDLHRQLNGHQQQHRDEAQLPAPQLPDTSGEPGQPPATPPEEASQ